MKIKINKKHIAPCGMNCRLCIGFIKEKTSLIRLGLEALIPLESSKRLARLGATEKELQDIPRRRIT